LQEQTPATALVVGANSCNGLWLQEQTPATALVVGANSCDGLQTGIFSFRVLTIGLKWIQ